MLLSAIAALVLAQYLRLWIAIPQNQARTSDFAGTYAAATLLRSGHAPQLYDLPAEEAVLAATGTPRDHLDIPFENPPAAAGIAVPLSLLDSATAYRVFSAVQLLLVVLAAWIAIRAAPWRPGTGRWTTVAIAAVAVAGLGSGLVLIEGQWDGVAALGLALAYAGWRRGLAGWPGVALGFTAAVAKPHLVLGLLAFMAGRRDWRGLAGAAAGGGLAVAVSVAVAGPDSVSAFGSALLQPSNSPVLYMQSAVGLTESWFGPGATTFAAGLLLSGAALLAAGLLGYAVRRNAGLLEPALCGATALSLFAAPHLLGHDITLLVPVVVAACAWLTTQPVTSRWPDGDTLLLIAAWVLVSLATHQDLGKATAGPPGRLTPLALLLFAVVAAAPVLRSRPAHKPDPVAHRTAA
jgi:Glycosyltransferase family 87